MKEEYYYLSPDQQRVGPFSLEEIIAQQITAQTLIWRNGLYQWTAASQVPEVATLLANTPPPPPSQSNANPANGNRFNSSADNRVNPYVDNGTNPYADNGNNPYADNGTNPYANNSNNPYANNGNNSYSDNRATTCPPEPTPYHECPETYLIWGILTTILCCLPFGIVAIYEATQVEKYYYRKEYEKSVKASLRARNWCIASAVAVAIPTVIYLCLFFTGALLSVY